MWRELIVELYPEAELTDPAAQEELSAIETELGLPLPSELASLLREVNGVRNSYGDDVVWPAPRIIADNLAARGDPDYGVLYAPLDLMLFFGDTDLGSQFAYVHTDYGPGIVYWDHHTDRRRLVSARLADYLTLCFRYGGQWCRQ